MYKRLLATMSPVSFYVLPYGRSQEPLTCRIWSPNGGTLFHALLAESAESGDENRASVHIG